MVDKLVVYIVYTKISKTSCFGDSVNKYNRFSFEFQYPPTHTHVHFVSLKDIKLHLQFKRHAGCRYPDVIEKGFPGRSQTDQIKICLVLSLKIPMKNWFSFLLIQFSG